MFFKRIWDLERRVKTLEQAQRTQTWKYGEVDLVKLARIVEGLDGKQRTADAATSAVPEINRDK